MNSRIYTLERSGMTSSVSNETTDRDIIFAIATGDVTSFKKIVNKNNANKVIDSKNRYTPLHHAIQARNVEMIRYLIQLDAEPSIKNGEGLDAFDMSIRFQVRALIDAELAERDNTIKLQQKTMSSNSEKISFLESTINIQNSQVTDLKDKVSSSNRELTQYKSKVEQLSNENATLNRKVITQKNEYDVLERTHTNLKRKYSEQETMIDNLLEASRKKK
jgi:ankyrin repeat protein